MTATTPILVMIVIDLDLARDRLKLFKLLIGRYGAIS
jgi:hypothetical protein